MKVLLHVLFNLFALTLIVQANDISPIEVDIFRQDILTEHNKLRSRHGAPDLKLNSELNEMANKQALDYSRSIEKRLKFHGNSLGENKFFVKGTNNFTGTNFTDFLYSKGKNFDYTLESFQNAGSFTQLLWKSSTDLGIGVLKNNMTLYIVALYYPAGNIVGGVINNVQPLITNKDVKSQMQTILKSNIIITVPARTTKLARPQVDQTSKNFDASNEEISDNSPTSAGEDDSDFDS